MPNPLDADCIVDFTFAHNSKEKLILKRKKYMIMDKYDFSQFNFNLVSSSQSIEIDKRNDLINPP